jgi:hypothetical protein
LKKVFDPQEWTRERIILTIQKFVEENGRLPKFGDWKHRGEDNPSRQAVIWRFGRWNTAIEAAGFQPRLVGGVVGSQPKRKSKELPRVFESPKPLEFLDLDDG